MRREDARRRVPKVETAMRAPLQLLLGPRPLPLVRPGVRRRLLGSRLRVSDTSVGCRRLGCEGRGPEQGRRGIPPPDRRSAIHPVGVEPLFCGDRGWPVHSWVLQRLTGQGSVLGSRAPGRSGPLIPSRARPARRPSLSLRLVPRCGPFPRPGNLGFLGECKVCVESETRVVGPNRNGGRSETVPGASASCRRGRCPTFSWDD